MNQTPRRPWLSAALLVVLLAGHGVILYFTASKLMMSAAVILGLIVLLVIKHVGVLGRTPPWIRQRRSGNRPGSQ